MTAALKKELPDSDMQSQDVEVKKDKQKQKQGYNSGLIGGQIVNVDFKRSGSAELTIDTNPNRKDSPIKNAPVPSFFTSKLLVRIPAPVIERVGKESIAKGETCLIPVELTGVRKVSDGTPFDLVELKGKDVIQFEQDEDSLEQQNRTQNGFNACYFSGYLVKVNFNKSGSAEIYIDTNKHRADTPIKGAPSTSFFTSTLFVRVPKPVVERVGKEQFTEGAICIIPGEMTGVNRIIAEQVYHNVELKAKDFRKLSN
jgi:hypothetical protein